MAQPDETVAHSELAVEQRYIQMCSDVRSTDDISFKLLGLVPVLSGVGIGSTLLGVSRLSTARAVLVGGLIGIFGATITFALYRWEARNVQHCERLRDLVDGMLLESGAPTLCQPSPHIFDRIGKGAPPCRTSSEQQPSGDPCKSDPEDRKWAFGKSEAEHLLYVTLIVSWLILPVAVAMVTTR